MNVYDFDHTIYQGDSSLDFFFFVLRRKPYLAVLAPVQIGGILLYLFRRISKEAMKTYFFLFVRFIPVETIAEEFWKRHTRKIARWYREQRNGGDVIISASPEFLLAPVVRGYLQCALIASQVDPKTGVYHGKNCFGEEKARRFRERYPGAGIDRFYSDSASDTPLAAMAERSFMVSGDRIIPWQAVKEPCIAKIKRTYVSKDFILFVLCGGMGTLANFLVSSAVSATVNPSRAYLAGYGIGIWCTYTFNRLLIFHAPFHFVQFIQFIISYLPNFLLLYTFVLVFLNILHWHKILVYALAGLWGLPVTFVLVKLIAFTKKDAPRNQGSGVIVFERSKELCKKKKLHGRVSPEHAAPGPAKGLGFSAYVKQRCRGIKANILNILYPPPPPPGT
jgi:phosphoserine phosphatase/putative flippase GtrA